MRAKWGKAKAEVFALSRQIIQLYSEGLNVGEIFKLLKSENKLNITSRSFYRHTSIILSQENSNSLILACESGQNHPQKHKLETSTVLTQKTPSPRFNHNNLTTDEEARQSWHQEQ